MADHGSARVRGGHDDRDSALEEKDEQQHSGADAARDWQEDDDEDPRSPTKLGLAFILNEHRGERLGLGRTREPVGESDLDASRVPPVWSARPAAAAALSPGRSPVTTSRVAASPPGHDRIAVRRRPRSASAGVAALTLTSPLAASEQTASTAAAAATATTTASRRQGRMCKAEGCTNYIVHKGLCCRHGGGKKCSVDGCDSSAKHGGRCWKHGGSVDCKVDGCTRKAKARGLCWGHGGGAKCQADACTKVAISNGFCWAHGGGKRCIFDGCQRPAFERTHSFCLQHYEQLQDVDYYEV